MDMRVTVTGLRENEISLAFCVLAPPLGAERGGVPLETQGALETVSS
jgi:hypothetical protein